MMPFTANLTRSQSIIIPWEYQDSTAGEAGQTAVQGEASPYSLDQPNGMLICPLSSYHLVAHVLC